MGSLKKMAERFKLPLKKGSFLHQFVKYSNFNYSGEVPEDSYFLTFGQTKLDDDTLEYLEKRRASGVPWDFVRKCMITVLPTFKFSDRDVNFSWSKISFFNPN